MLANEIEKWIVAEKKVEDLKKLLDSIKKNGLARTKYTAWTFQNVRNLLKNELQRGKDGEVAVILKLEDNALGYFKRNIGVKNCFSKIEEEETRPQKKDRGTETSEDIALLTEEIEKRKKAEKKVL